MIKYVLRCERDETEFEAWFDKGADFDEQKARGLVVCPVCGSRKIDKAPMAPAILRSKPGLAKLAENIRKDIEDTHSDVGEKFSEEARAMHYGEKPERGIYGMASVSEAKALCDEGIPVLPLPEILVPKSKKKLN